MIFKKINLGIICLLILLLFVAFNSSTWAQSPSHIKLDPTRVSWTGLSFHAKNIWVDVTTNVEIKALPTNNAQSLLIKSTRGAPVKPAEPYVSQMTINTTIDPTFRSAVNIYNRIWFNPGDAAAIGRIRLRRGEDDFKKMYRFTDQGVFRHRMEPKNKKEASLEPEQWTDVKDSFYPYDKVRLGCSGVTERSLLIYIISTADVVKNSDPLSLCVFGKRQLHRVKLQHAGLAPIKVNYIEKKQESEKHKQEIVKTHKINLSTEPMESDLTAAENFSFLGFHKDISIYIDPASGIPIRASGIIPSAGKAELNLNKVWLRNQNRF